MLIEKNTVISSARSRRRARLASKAAGVFLIAWLGVGCEPDSSRSGPGFPDVDIAVGDEDFFSKSCAPCHGGHGEGKAELFSPSIAGLPWWYVEDQMKQFRDGHRGVHPDDVPGQQMRAISLSLTDEQISKISSDVEAMPAIPTPAPPENTNLEGARYRYANECMACHRYNGTGDRVFQSAPLVTLNPDYLIRQMKNYRDGLRGAIPGDLYGIKMVEVCKTLSDDDIDAMADYIGALANGDDPRVAWER